MKFVYINEIVYVYLVYQKVQWSPLPSIRIFSSLPKELSYPLVVTLYLLYLPVSENHETTVSINFLLCTFHTNAIIQ